MYAILKTVLYLCINIMLEIEITVTAEKLCRTDLKMSVAWELVVKRDGNLFQYQNNFKGASTGVFKNQFCTMSMINYMMGQTFLSSLIFKGSQLQKAIIICVLSTCIQSFILKYKHVSKSASSNTCIYYKMW